MRFCGEQGGVWKKGSKFVHARPVFGVEGFWIDHVVDVIAGLFVGFNDGCLGFDEGKVVASQIQNHADL